MRRTRALCKFNCGKVRCRDAPRLCGRARQKASRADWWERISRRQRCGDWKKRFVPKQGAGAWSMPKRAKNSSSNKSFHAATVTRAGGERSWISAAESLSMTFIGPPHFGQRQRSLESLLPEMSCSVCGAEPRRWKQSGRSVARRRLARNPKLRMRTKPLGSTCNKKRRKNSSSDRVSNFCSLL